MRLYIYPYTCLYTCLHTIYKCDRAHAIDYQHASAHMPAHISIHMSMCQSMHMSNTTLSVMRCHIDLAAMPTWVCDGYGYQILSNKDFMGY